jgi:hypothetical protein
MRAAARRRADPSFMHCTACRTALHLRAAAAAVAQTQLPGRPAAGCRVSARGGVRARRASIACACWLRMCELRTCECRPRWIYVYTLLALISSCRKVPGSEHSAAPLQPVFFYFLAFFRKIFTSRSFLERFQKMDPELGVGELRKIRHPRNVKFDKVLETCFQEQETHDFREPGTCEASNS